MKNEHHYMEYLIGKFFEGKTSNDEEKELWLYFSGNNIPDHLEQYREFFLYYNDGLTKELGKRNPVLIRHNRKTERARIRRIITVAAVAAILVFAVIFTFTKSSVDGFEPYEGSYMVINGEKIYDIELIKQQEKEIYEMVAAREKEYRDLYTRSE